MHRPVTRALSCVVVIAVIILAGLVVAVASDQGKPASSASPSPNTCFRPQTSLMMSPSGTLRQEFQFYIPCRDSHDVDDKGFLVFPEA